MLNKPIVATHCPDPALFSKKQKEEEVIAHVYKLKSVNSEQNGASEEFCSTLSELRNIFESHYDYFRDH